MSSNTKTDHILIERAHQDFEDGLVHLRAHIRESHGRFAGAALDALIMGGVSALGVRAQMRSDVRDLLAIAHKVNAGEDVRKLAEAHLDKVLRLKSKMHLIAREDDPAFKEIRARCLDLFERRLPDLAKLAAVKDPADYDDLVRKAFPDRSVVDALVSDNATAVAAIIDHLETHPHVLRMPASMAPKLAEVAREMISWKVAEVRKGVDAIYAGAT